MQFEQAYPPGRGVATVFDTEQVAVGGQEIDANEHGLSRLEDLIVATDPDAAQILSVVPLLGWADGCLDDVEYRAHG